MVTLKSRFRSRIANKKCTENATVRISYSPFEDRIALKLAGGGWQPLKDEDHPLVLPDSGCPSDGYVEDELVLPLLEEGLDLLLRDGALVVRDLYLVGLDGGEDVHPGAAGHVPPHDDVPRPEVPAESPGRLVSCDEDGTDGHADLQHEAAVEGDADVVDQPAVVPGLHHDLQPGLAWVARIGDGKFLHLEEIPSAWKLHVGEDRCGGVAEYHVVYMCLGDVASPKSYVN